MGSKNQTGQITERSEFFLGCSFISFSEIEKQVEGTIEMIEKLLSRTNWLAQEDKVAVYDWIQAQKKAAEDCKTFIDRRTRKVTEFILMSQKKRPPGKLP